MRPDATVHGDTYRVVAEMKHQAWIGSCFAVGGAAEGRTSGPWCDEDMGDRDP